MSKTKLRVLEMIIILLTGIITIITQPKIPLLSIPFLIIITTRTIFSRLEDEVKNE